MKKPLIEINDFKGGMTLNEKMGRKDQFDRGYQLDFSSKIGFLAPGYAWKNMVDASDNAYMPDEFSAILHAMEDDNIYFAGDDTKIYKIDGDGKVAVSVDSDQTGVVRSLAEYEGYMVYVQNTTLGTSDLAATPTYDHDFKTGLTNADYHPLFVSANGKLYFGHGRYVGYLTDPSDNTTVTLNGLDLKTGWIVRTLCDFGYRYLAVGTSFYTSTYKPPRGKIFLWDRVSSSWNDEIIIPEKDIKAMIFEAGYLWIWAGRSCNLYVVPEGSRKATKLWTFVKEDPADDFEVYPNAVIARNGTIYFGLSSVGTDSKAVNPSAIYSFPADPNRFSLNLVYQGGTISGADDRFKSLGLYRHDNGDTIFASYYDDSATNKNLLRRETLWSGEKPYTDTAVYESFRFDAPRNKQIFTEAFGLAFESLPSGCTLNLSYKKDDETSYTTIITNYSTASTHEKIVYERIRADSIKLQLTLDGSSSAIDRPFVKSIFITGTLIDKA